MTELYKEILADLKEQFQGQIRLAPKDIASLIKQTPEAQGMMRGRGTFPIPFTRAGNRVYITIYDLAKYLEDPSAFNTAPAPKQEKVSSKTPKPSPSKGIPVKASRRGFSLGKSLSMFQSTIQQMEMELQFMKDLFLEIEQLQYKKKLDSLPSIGRKSI